MYADPDPDPAAQINADPCGSGSETLVLSVFDFSGSFLPSWIRIRIANPDTDPGTPLNQDQIRIRIHRTTTLETRIKLSVPVGIRKAFLDHHTDVNTGRRKKLY
jgi:hypothetical protein